MRSSAGARFQLDPNKTTQYSGAWVALALALTAAGLIARRPGPILVAALLLTIIPVAWAWNRLALRGLRYERVLSEQRAFVGEEIRVTVRIQNRKLLPVGWLQVDDEFPIELTLQDAGRTSQQKLGLVTAHALYSMRWYEQTERVFTARCEQRGYFNFGATFLKSGDMFGLFENRATLPARDWLLVYPRVWPLAALGLPAKDPLGDRAVRRRMFEDPTRTIGIRDYGPQDDRRRIHWKATARRGQLQVRVQEPTTAYNLLVFLNVANFERFWHGYDPQLLEKTISVAASVANYGAERRYAVGLVANGCLPGSDQPIRMLPGRSASHLTRLLELLAAVTPIASAPVEDLLITESSALPWGSTIVVVTGIVTPNIADSIGRLVAAGRRMELISLAEPAPPEIEGALVYHLPGLRDAGDDAATLAAGLAPDMVGGAP